MGKRKARKNTKQSAINKDNGDQNDIPLDKKEEAFEDHEVERQNAAIRAVRDVEIEQLRNTLRLLRSFFTNEQLGVPVLQFFKENLPNLSIAQTGNNGRCEVQWKDKNGNLSVNLADERAMHASLLNRMSIACPEYLAGVSSLGGFEFSNKSVKTGVFCVDKQQSSEDDFHMLKMKDGMQTPDASNNRLSVGMTPKTLRVPKRGEMILSMHGSPLGVYKEEEEENMGTIQETEDD